MVRGCRSAFLPVRTCRPSPGEPRAEAGGKGLESRGEFGRVQRWAPEEGPLSRPLRVEYEGVKYHLMDRRRERGATVRRLKVRRPLSPANSPARALSFHHRRRQSCHCALTSCAPFSRYALPLAVRPVRFDSPPTAWKPRSGLFRRGAPVLAYDWRRPRGRVS